MGSIPNISPSSSPAKSSDIKPLNPLAPSFYLPHHVFQSQHRNEAPSEPALLPQVPAPQPTGICNPNIDVYNSEMQPKPWIYHGPDQKMVGKKKNGSQRFIPPRLRCSGEFPKQAKLVWVVKSNATNDVVNSGAPSVAAEEQTVLGGNTSVMIKNVPNHFKRVDLLRILDDQCLAENRKADPETRSAYNFLYLAMDFGFDLNLGFAFVNFTSADAALRFHKAFDNREWMSGESRKKTCKIGIAKLRGTALKEQFKRSCFPCHTDEYLPVVFSPPRDGFDLSMPKLVGRRTYSTANGKDQKAMIMTQRKNKKV